MTQNSKQFLAIYYIGFQNIKRDVKKSIEYLTLAAKNNEPYALYLLGHINLGKMYPWNIDQAIHYLTLSAKLKNPMAMFELVNIYFFGEYVEPNFNLAIHYLINAANHNYLDAQYFCGMMYAKGIVVKKNILRGIDYFIRSTQNSNKKDLLGASHFAVGFFYLEGKYISKDIKKWFHHYKEASNLNYYKAKNNLGVI